MGGQRINTRLTFTIIIQLVILVVIGLMAYVGMNRVSGTVADLNQDLSEQIALNRLGETLRSQLVATANGVARGTRTWEQANQILPVAKVEFREGLHAYLAAKGALDLEHFTEEGVHETDALTDTELAASGLAGLEEVEETFTEIESLFARRDRGQLSLFIANDLDELLTPFFENLVTNLDRTQERATRDLEIAQGTSNTFTWLIVVIGLIGIVVSFGLGTATYRAITNPLVHMMSTVQDVGQGNYSARTNLRGADELSELGQAFDNMLDDRVNALVQAERENEQLNNSIINLLQAVAQLSQRDLTIKVPVTEDVTGPVADSLNLLTAETAEVLRGVTRISENVATASNQVKSQSDAVILVANAERQNVEQTAGDLAEAAETMQQIALLAQECNTVAEAAIASTRTALQTVTSTVDGINNTRDTIRETEKRIKRLGERSQEISGVVNLINTIAERTHILALNASMHAASAGEAGRGFAVVADEVQRLAENAREATSQIATLVSNIQIETADTVNAMNAAISQVVDGSRLAEQSGEQMQHTQVTTTELVEAVRQIATRSQQQATVSNTLLERARQIQDSTRQTGEQLSAQTVQTDNLVEYAKNLLESVRVFRLPT